MLGFWRKTNFSVLISDGGAAAQYLPGGEASLGITLIDFETREGFFKDMLGKWHKDRRATPDRRETRTASAAIRAMRSGARRKIDRELLKFLVV